MPGGKLAVCYLVQTVNTVNAVHEKGGKINERQQVIFNLPAAGNQVGFPSQAGNGNRHINVAEYKKINKSPEEFQSRYFLIGLLVIL